jgi:hypothetical protein
MLRFFRDQAVEPLLGLALIAAAVIGAGYGLTTHSSVVVQVVGGGLLATGLILALINAWVFLELLYEHFISPEKIRFQFPLRLPVKIGEESQRLPPRITEPRIVEKEKLVEVEPPDYRFLKQVQQRDDGRSHNWITPVAERTFSLQGWIITKNELKPRFVLQGKFYNSSIYSIIAEKAEGHITIEGAGSLDSPSVQMTEFPSGFPHNNFTMRIIFELTHESSVAKLRELREKTETFQITVDGLRVYFRVTDDVDVPLARLAMSGKLAVPIGP